MKNSMIEVRDKILKLLDDTEKKQLPRRVIEQRFLDQISSLLDDFIVDLVVEYPSEDSGLNTGRPCWFLKLLSNDEKTELHELSPLKLSFLRILQEKDDEGFPGEVPKDDVKSKLIALGFPEDKAEWVHVAGKVDQVSVSRENGMVRCYMIIPEYEKTEEYKKSIEDMDLRATEKELREMKFDEESSKSAGEKDDE